MRNAFQRTSLLLGILGVLAAVPTARADSYLSFSPASANLSAGQQAAIEVYLNLDSAAVTFINGDGGLGTIGIDLTTLTAPTDPSQVLTDGLGNPEIQANTTAFNSANLTATTSAIGNGTNGLPEATLFQGFDLILDSTGLAVDTTPLLLGTFTFTAGSDVGTTTVHAALLPGDTVTFITPLDLDGSIDPTGGLSNPDLLLNVESGNPVVGPLPGTFYAGGALLSMIGLGAMMSRRRMRGHS